MLQILAVIVIAIGMGALALPIVPGVAIIYLGVLLLAWADDFTRIGAPTLVVLLALMFVGLIADNVAGLFGARRAGASGWGVFGAGVGALLGLPFGLPGVIFGPAVGALAFEYIKNPDLKRAGRAGLGGLLGFVLGIVAKCAVGLMMVGVVLFAYFF